MTTPRRVWQRTAYRSLATHGPARVCIEADRLLIELDLYRIVRKLLRRTPAPTELLVTDVVRTEIVKRHGSPRFHIVTGHGISRREYWLSAWVGDAWSRVAPDLPGPTPP